MLKNFPEIFLAHDNDVCILFPSSDIGDEFIVFQMTNLFNFRNSNIGFFFIERTKLNT